MAWMHWASQGHWTMPTDGSHSTQLQPKQFPNPISIYLEANPWLLLLPWSIRSPPSAVPGLRAGPLKSVSGGQLAALPFKSCHRPHWIAKSSVSTQLCVLSPTTSGSSLQTQRASSQETAAFLLCMCLVRFDAKMRIQFSSKWQSSADLAGVTKPRAVCLCMTSLPGPALPLGKWLAWSSMHHAWCNVTLLPERHQVPGTCDM